MKAKESKFAYWILNEYQSIYSSLPIYRIIFALTMLLIVLPRYLWISSFPDTFFLPRIGMTLFFSGFPHIIFFYLLNFSLISSLLALLFGYKTFYSSLTVAILVFIGNSWSYSFGQITHDIFLILIPLLLSFSCWGESVKKEDQTSNGIVWPVPLFALLIGLAMLTSSLAKITSGWLDPNISAMTGHLANNYFGTGRVTISSTYLLSTNSFYLFKTLDYSTIIIECAFIFSIYKLRTFKLVCAFACLFHMGVMLIMEIVFIHNILAYAVFVNWSYLYNLKPLERGLITFQVFTSNISFIRIIFFAVPISVLYIFIGNPFSLTLEANEILGGTIFKFFFMLIAMVISLNYIYLYFLSIIKKKHARPVKKQVYDL